ncbi:hypothetical protein Tdes44962_MAKER06595 [Teratosphaeria destructans]|uniref:Uncharacterized protein n=1 Tax=Teratosphaeria destructans TaxID=418781 RepID=A0A9W7T1U2_9PEZI|nr:hypothetical protein Tdes44962_MAKER06595 [Teratosphaeria destructans]
MPRKEVRFNLPGQARPGESTNAGASSSRRRISNPRPVLKGSRERGDASARGRYEWEVRRREEVVDGKKRVTVTRTLRRWK